ncbi:ABC transporter ATP-binding protein [Devosia naphthalenivorans]|uniref:ABC transporter ATP-binding protein n=1 Tax=Devosia naphthalenivorans TaxID=2082392 RepID=UPI000D3D5641|nr:ABC transporter ATP-binding protein [Devosia naphthalenivorans]
MSVLRVEGLSKSFRSYRHEWHRIAGWFGLNIAPAKEVHVLRGLDFSVERGSAVGIVGENGAGKSTLLKIITGTLQPTAGSVHIDGRVAAILELGMGFNGDLTGRENVVNTASMMGIGSDEISALMPGIEEFAGINAYFEQPMRTYSSGMQMRVAFAVATARRPEILIVDEALSVGDAYFQHKSFSRIREFQKQGTTLLLVSHDRASIVSLCDRVLLLSDGKVLMDGHPQDVMDLYNALIARKEGYEVKQVVLPGGRTQTTSGTGEASIAAVELLNAAGERIETVSVGEPVTLRVMADIHQDLPEMVVGYMIRDRLGQPIFGTNTFHLQRILAPHKGERIQYSFSFPANLGIGNYSLAISLHKGDEHVAGNYEWRDLAYVFTVVNPAHSPFVGTAWLPPELEVSRAG